MINVNPLWKLSATEVFKLETHHMEAGGIAAVRNALICLSTNRQLEAFYALLIGHEEIKKHPHVYIQVRKMFGCHLHGAYNCRYQHCDKIAP